MTTYLGRRYRLCASHRLFHPEWDELRNQEMFGKCANPHGHGHNYVVEVLAGGPVDPVTGMIIDLVPLDKVVAREVVEPFDRANLNLHAAFAGCVPTSENFCIEIFERLHAALHGMAGEAVLRQVRVEETPNNSFTYTGGQAAPGSRGTAKG